MANVFVPLMVTVWFVPALNVPMLKAYGLVTTFSPAVLAMCTCETVTS
jgi:hypothetical protein